MRSHWRRAIRPCDRRTPRPSSISPPARTPRPRARAAKRYRMPATKARRPARCSSPIAQGAMIRPPSSGCSAGSTAWQRPWMKVRRRRQRRRMALLPKRPRATKRGDSPAVGICHPSRNNGGAPPPPAQRRGGLGWVLRRVVTWRQPGVTQRVVIWRYPPPSTLHPPPSTLHPSPPRRFAGGGTEAPVATSPIAGVHGTINNDVRRCSRKAHPPHWHSLSRLP